jgi:general secretion pathway protein A
MYKAFYGLSRDPFPKDIEPSHMFTHAAFNELSGRLDYMKKHRGIMLLTGDPGTGKTTALRNFVSSLNQDMFMPIYIPLATVAIGDFYRQLNDALKGNRISTKSALFRSIQERILYYALQLHKVPVIIIDEAHLLKNENFYELQIISNFKMDSIDPALFIIAAQSHLNDRLDRSILESFNQRVNIKFHMSSLSLLDVTGYIQHHLKLAGGSADVLTDNACKAVYNLSGGIIRKIGQLVIKTLSLGVSIKKHILTEEEVLLASKEM